MVTLCHLRRKLLRRLSHRVGAWLGSPSSVPSVPIDLLTGDLVLFFFTIRAGDLFSALGDSFFSSAFGCSRNPYSRRHTCLTRLCFATGAFGILSHPRRGLETGRDVGRREVALEGVHEAASLVQVEGLKGCGDVEPGLSIAKKRWV
jgi:hypothetical protein